MAVRAVEILSERQSQLLRDDVDEALEMFRDAYRLYSRLLHSASLE
jgi:hypothetical protein